MATVTAGAEATMMATVTAGAEATSMAATAGTATRGIREVGMRLRESVRLRLAPYFLLLALPLAIGIWAFGNFAAGNARDRADTRLNASLTAAVSAYRRDVQRAAAQAEKLAGTPRIQRAVRERDRRALAHEAARHPDAVFLAGGDVLAGRVTPGAPTRTVRISDHGRVIGAVAVAVPMDDDVLSGLQVGLGPAENQRVVGFEGRSATAGPHRGERVTGEFPALGDLRLGGDEYRAATAKPVRDSPLRLAVIEPRSAVSASEDRARRRVVLAGLAILGGVALAALALAPALARTRSAQAQRAQAAQVLSHVGDGVFLVDQGGTISLWNPGAENMTGVNADRVLGRRPEDIFRHWSENAPRPTPSAERPVAKTGRYELDGNELWLSVSAVESPVGTVYAFRDLTEEYRLEETRSDFVATVSHELRTPLASIHGAANTLRSRDEQLQPSTRRQLLEVVFEQSERLAHLVDQILLANQLSSGSAHVERRSFDAAPVARDVVAALRHTTPPGIDVALNTPSDLPPALGDPERVRQILVNLVDNACKYSPRGGRIDVTLAPANGNVRFSVRDEGLGIPGAEQRRIFEKFYRLDAGMTRGVGGSGLGLFICRELVALMDGRLWVTSRPGVGSTFWFELPGGESESAALGATGA
jgi:PAS domain S-box-containing protein